MAAPLMAVALFQRRNQVKTWLGKCGAHKFFVSRPKPTAAPKIMLGMVIGPARRWGTQPSIASRSLRAPYRKACMPAVAHGISLSREPGESYTLGVGRLACGGEMSGLRMLKRRDS